MFYENFLHLCNQKNVKPNQVTNHLGLSNATATAWKKGKIPRDITIKKIADYFGISTEELLGEPKTTTNNQSIIGSKNFSATFINGSQLSEQEIQLLNTFKQLNVLDKAKVLIYAEDLKNKKD